MMTIDILGRALSMYIVFCAAWISAAGIVAQFKKPTARTRRPEAMGGAGVTGNAYALMQRVG